MDAESPHSRVELEGVEALTGGGGGGGVVATRSFS